MWLGIYWIVCGLILFGLTNPTVEITYFNRSHLFELVASMLIGGIIIPILILVGIIYVIKSIIKGEL